MHDHRRPNLPKFFFEAVVWRSRQGKQQPHDPARLGGPLGYVVRNYPAEKRRFPLLEAGPIRTEPRMEPDIVVTHGVLTIPEHSTGFMQTHLSLTLPSLFTEIDSQPRVLLATPTPLFGDDLAPFDSKVMSQ